MKVEALIAMAVVGIQEEIHEALNRVHDNCIEVAAEVIQEEMNGVEADRIIEFINARTEHECKAIKNCIKIVDAVIAMHIDIVEE